MAQLPRKTSSARSEASADGAPAAGNVAEYTVSELSGAVKRSLEDTFGYVRLRGEISGYRGPHASGHCYFGLKDDKAKIEAVIWRGSFQKLRFKPEEGMEVIAHGRLTTYPGSSKYQIVIETLEPAGVGALMALLEERKRKFAAEGLFTEERKRRLPFLPRVVGIVTSPTGAVIRDMLHGFDERFPTHVIVWPVRVQGETSAGEVAAAIRGFNALPASAPGGTQGQTGRGAIPRPDVLIVARGGGSLEDLWGFNEEVVVRAAADSQIPLISAVGHETDWTLLDLVADARAPTPTKAAEWAVPKWSDLIEGLADRAQRLALAIRRRLEADRAALLSAGRGLPRPQDMVALPRQRLDGLDGRLPLALRANTAAHERRLSRLDARLSPRLVEVRLARAGDRIEALAGRARQALARITTHRRTRFERAAGRLGPDLTRMRLATARTRLDEAERRGALALLRRLEARRASLETHAKLLQSLSYHSVLSRGFAVVRDAEGNALRHVADSRAGQRLAIELADGTITAETLTSTAHPGASTPPATDPSPRATPGAKRPPAGQGSLF